MRTVLVTGATGLTGRIVAELLAERGERVVGISRQRSRRPPRGVHPVFGDCADPEIMGPLLERADVLIHVAGITLAPTIAGSPAFRAPATVVVVSSAAVRSRHRASASVYAAAERAVLAARSDATIVRPTMIYGSRRDRNVHHVVDVARRFHMLPLIGDGAARLQPIHFCDVARAIVALADRSSVPPIEIGGGDAPTIREACETVFRALGLAPRFIRVPLRPALALATLVDGIVGTRAYERIARMTEERTVDNTRAIEITGVRPRTFNDGVRDLVAGGG